MALPLLALGAWCANVGRRPGSPLRVEQMFARSPSQAECRGAAEPVITALRRYKAKHGSFPKALQDLVPEFLDRVPRPPWGDAPWAYEIDAKDGSFTLGCGEECDAAGNLYPVDWWIESKGIWYFDS